MFQHLIYLDDPLKRDFYAEMCRMENWDTRTLAKKIQSMLFERTALSKMPNKLIREDLDRLVHAAFQRIHAGTQVGVDFSHIWPAAQMMHAARKP